MAPGNVRTWSLWMPSGQLFLSGPEILLVPWIVSVVATAVARDQRGEENDTLAVTPLPGDDIIMAKTFAPALGGIIALGAVRGAVVLTGDPRFAGAAAPVLDPSGSALAQAVALTVEAVLLPAVLAVHGVLIPICWAMLAGRIATHVRQIHAAVTVALVIGLAALAVATQATILGWLVLPLLGAYAVLLMVVKLQTGGLAFLVAAFLTLGVFKFTGDEASFFFVLLTAGLVALALALVTLLGIESGAGFFGLGLLAFWMGLLLELEFLGGSTAPIRAYEVSLLLLLLLLAHRWLRWTARDFKRLYFPRR
jgi:hypothetical protein